MLLLKVETAMSIISSWKMYFFVIPCFLYRETSFSHLDNSLALSEFGLIDYIVINNVHTDVIPTK